MRLAGGLAALKGSFRWRWHIDAAPAALAERWATLEFTAAETQLLRD
jgi:hypothetical protein